MNEDEIIEKIKAFMDKQGLDKQGQYFITKKVNEDLWDDINGTDKEEAEEDFDDFETEPEGDEDIFQDDKPKKKARIQKPKVKPK